MKLAKPSLLVGLLMLLGGCAELPTQAERDHTQALQDTDDTRLGQAAASRVAAHPGKSGIAVLDDGLDAFAARILLARAAERSLDIQYYIWEPDLSGTLLFQALREAADRGVRVRLLLDDNNTDGLDRVLAALHAHENIEVRLFNPFVNRRWRALGYVTDFARLNRRMHNKSFTADNQATIIGGRNIGDPYFGAPSDIVFADLDVLAIGPVVREVSTDFDRYWASASAYPADKIIPPVDATAELTHLAEAAEAATRTPEGRVYMDALKESPLVQQMLERRLEFIWAPTMMVSDDPAKGLGQAEDGGLLLDALNAALKTPERELLLVSPYFVPTAAGVDALSALAASGVEIAILTNSLEATDIDVVHAGYAKHRERLLEAGIRLFELRRSAAPPTVRDRGITGSSASSLHAKTFAVDGQRAFIGSFNFDPRSAQLNTELGFLIESPEIASATARIFQQRVPENAYEVRLGSDGDLQWLERRDGEEIVHTTEPGTGLLERVMVRVMSALPIEWLL